MSETCATRKAIERKIQRRNEEGTGQRRKKRDMVIRKPKKKGNEKEE